MNWRRRRMAYYRINLSKIKNLNNQEWGWWGIYNELVCIWNDEQILRKYIWLHNNIQYRSKYLNNVFIVCNWLLLVVSFVWSLFWLNKRFGIFCCCKQYVAVWPAHFSAKFKPIDYWLCNIVHINEINVESVILYYYLRFIYILIWNCKCNIYLFSNMKNGTYNRWCAKKVDKMVGGWILSSIIG